VRNVPEGGPAGSVMCDVAALQEEKGVEIHVSLSGSRCALVWRR
jgi:hypothetical protein